MKIDELEQTMKVVLAPRPDPPKPPSPVVLKGEVLDEEPVTDFGYSIHLLEKVLSALDYLGSGKISVLQPEDVNEIQHLHREIQVFVDDVDADDEEEDDDDPILACPQCDYDNRNNPEVKACPDCFNSPELVDENEINDPEPPDDPAYQGLNPDTPPDPDGEGPMKSENWEEEDGEPSMNLGGCKNLVMSSCIRTIKDVKKWCDPCKIWYASYYYNGQVSGALLVADDGDLSETELHTLNNMAIASGVDI